MQTMKTKRTYQSGRPITGWTYGLRIKGIGQVRVGDYLIGDSHCFRATNLYRVIKIIRDPGDAEPSRFIVLYVRPNRRTTGENAGMCAWYWDLDPQNYSYYQAKRLPKKVRPRKATA
jgi:hypothetical protein